MSAATELELHRWRSTSATCAFVVIADYAKRDASFIPLKNPTTQRWHVAAGTREFEILVTGSRFFDMRSQKGGSGAIDLAMHLRSLTFKQAVALLRHGGL